MALHVWAPGDWRPDPGDQGKEYPIEKEEEIYEQEIVYDNCIQRTSYNQANIVACFNEWIQSFFDPNYFKFVRIRTQSAYSEFKSFMKNIYKKEKPFMVIDPRSIEPVEDSLFGQNMINRYNLIDPANDDIGAKLLYSMAIMKDETFELVYRRNRFRFEFDVMIMEQTMDRQMNTFNKMLMDIRHNSKFLIHRTVPLLLPSKYIQNIANLHGMDWKSTEFLNYLNSISQYPVIRRVIPNGQYLFFFQQEMNLQFEVPNLPSKDSPENSEAIEWGARIVDNFIVIADLPSEYLFLTPKEYMTKYDKSIPEDPESVYYISPIYADMDWPTEIDGYTLTTRLDIMLTSDDIEKEETSMDLLPIIVNETPPEIGNTIEEYVKRMSKIDDLVLVKVYPNGSLHEAHYTVDNAGVLKMTSPEPDKLYTVNIYVNLRTINLIHEGKTKEYIGTIEKY